MATAAQPDRVRDSGCSFARPPCSALSVIAFGNPPQGKIFIEIGPMQPKGRNLDVVQLLGRSSRKTGILRDWELNLRAALQRDQNLTIPKNGGTGSVNQGAHATSE